VSQRCLSVPSPGIRGRPPGKVGDGKHVGVKETHSPAQPLAPVGDDLVAIFHRFGFVVVLAASTSSFDAPLLPAMRRSSSPTTTRSRKARCGQFSRKQHTTFRSPSCVRIFTMNSLATASICRRKAAPPTVPYAQAHPLQTFSIHTLRLKKMDCDKKVARMSL
jgi:hypothetical protein